MGSGVWFRHASLWRPLLLACAVIFGVLAMHTLMAVPDAPANHPMSAGSLVQGVPHHELAVNSGWEPTEHQGGHDPGTMGTASMMCLGMIVGFRLLLRSLRDPTRRRGLLRTARVWRLLSVVVADRAPPSLAQFSILRC